ncbi:MAG: hypothetical protein AAGB22_04240 [Bacteroidota bacterium]
MFYLTYNAPSSGIFKSQVIDVVELWQREFHCPVRLVAFISIRGFWSARQRIQKELPGSIVVPSFPRNRYWRVNIVTLLLLALIYRPKSIMARAVYAADLALMVRKLGLTKRVCYDGRTAYAAEVQEYDVLSDPKLAARAPDLERAVVLHSDFRLTVADRIVDYWREQYGLAGEDHVVVPCTLSRSFQVLTIEAIKAFRTKVREQLGFADADIVLVYSGSASGWQSFGLLRTLLEKALALDPRIKVLLLTKTDEQIQELIDRHPGRIVARWVKHHEVQGNLAAGDYGIIFRENTVTNRMTAPTKFAEYLATGLNVIVSQNLAITPLVADWQIGQTVHNETFEGLSLSAVDAAQKQRALDIATDYYHKDAPVILEKYRKLLSFLMA